MSSLGNEVLEHERALAMDGLLSVANFFGAGSAVEGTIRRVFGKKELPTSAEIEAVVTQLISKAKAKNEAELTKLQNKLSDIPLVKSTLQREVIDKKIKDLRDQIAKRTANTSLADDLASSALNTANSISYSTASERKSLAKEAEAKAEKAKQIYENAGDPTKIEQTI